MIARQSIINYVVCLQAAIATCEDGVRSKQSQVIVESTTLAARLSNRLLMALARESENSEDVALKKQINQSENKLKMVIAPFVESSKAMAINLSDSSHQARWRAASANLVAMVQEVAKLFSDLQLHSPTSAPPPPPPPPPPRPSSRPRQHPSASHCRASATSSAIPTITGDNDW